jgi:ribosome-associated heat shock protein Hsp15
MPEGRGTRIDKWLWAARFFKTRALASRACDLGRILIHNQPAKPAREVHPNDLLQIKNDSGDFEIKVLVLSEIRGPAAAARTLYEETEQSKKKRTELAEAQRLMPHFELERTGKPSKRDRRRMDKFRNTE